MNTPRFLSLCGIALLLALTAGKQSLAEGPKYFPEPKMTQEEKNKFFGLPNSKYDNNQLGLDPRVYNQAKEPLKKTSVDDLFVPVTKGNDKKLGGDPIPFTKAPPKTSDFSKKDLEEFRRDAARRVEFEDKHSIYQPRALVPEKVGAEDIEGGANRAVQFLGVLQKGFAGMDKFKGIAVSAQASAVVGVGGSIEAHLFDDDKVHFYCSAGANIVTDIAASAGVAQIKTSTKCTADDYTGPMISGSVGVGLPIAKLGVGFSYGVGFDHKLLAVALRDIVKEIHDKKNAAVANANAVLGAAFQDLFKGRVMTPAQMGAMNTVLGILKAPFAGAAVNSLVGIDAMIKTLPTVLKDGPKLLDPPTPINAKELVGELIGTLDALAKHPNTDGTVKTVAALYASALTKIRTALSGCDATSRGVGVGVGLSPSPVSGAISMTYSPYLGYIEKNRLPGLGAAAVNPVALAREVADCVNNPVNHPLTTVGTLAYAATTPGYAHLCVAPGLNAACNMYRIVNQPGQPAHELLAALRWINPAIAVGGAACAGLRP